MKNGKPDILFTSDLHFNHEKVIEYSKRPFASLHDMTEALIHKWNFIVDRGDVIYVLGDFALTNNTTDKGMVEDILSRLNGNKHLITGNHDRKAVTEATGWSWAGNYKSIKVKDSDCHGGNQKIVLFHYAIRSWQNIGRGAWHLYGHSHGNLPKAIGKSLDVGVDANGYYPVSYQEIKARMQSKEIFTEDHHK